MNTSRYHQAKERSRLRAESRREQDTIYYVLFQRKTWKYGDSIDDRYIDRITAFGNPETNTAALQDAIQRFQTKHGVTDWNEIASEYTFDNIWNP